MATTLRSPLEPARQQTRMHHYQVMSKHIKYLNEQVKNLTERHQLPTLFHVRRRCLLVTRVHIALMRVPFFFYT